MSWPRQGLLLAQYTHKSFWLHTCTSWDANPCMFVVYSIISTDQIPKEPYMVRVRRTFAFLSPKQLESQLKLRFVSKGSIFWDLFPISRAPGILVKCSLSVRYTDWQHWSVEAGLLLLTCFQYEKSPHWPGYFCTPHGGVDPVSTEG